MDYYLLNREEAKEKGYLWEDFSSDINYEFSDYDISDNIKDVKEDILEKILKCEISGKAYKIIKKNLIFIKNEFTNPQKESKGKTSRKN